MYYVVDVVVKTCENTSSTNTIFIFVFISLIEYLDLGATRGFDNFNYT